MKICTLAFPIRNGRVTLAARKRGIGVGLLNGYGGKMEPEDDGDTGRTNIREFCAETGARAWDNGMEKFGVIDFFKAGEHIFTCYGYICWRWYGEIKETDEMGPPEEFDITNLPLNRMMPGDRLWFDKIIRGEKIRAKVFYNVDNTEVLDFQCEPLHP